MSREVGSDRKSQGEKTGETRQEGQEEVDYVSSKCILASLYFCVCINSKTLCIVRT